jgi:hypothetical protein
MMKDDFVGEYRKMARGMEKVKAMSHLASR